MDKGVEDLENWTILIDVICVSSLSKINLWFIWIQVNWNMLFKKITLSFMICWLLTGVIRLNSNVTSRLYMTKSKIFCKLCASRFYILLVYQRKLFKEVVSTYFVALSYSLGTRTMKNSKIANQRRIYNPVYDEEFYENSERLFSCWLLSQKRSIIDVRLGSKYMSANYM